MKLRPVIGMSEEPRTVTMRHGAVHVRLPDDCPCNPIIRVSTEEETDWRLGPGVHHVRVHPAIGQDTALMEMVQTSDYGTSSQGRFR